MLSAGQLEVPDAVPNGVQRGKVIGRPVELRPRFEQDQRLTACRVSGCEQGCCSAALGVAQDGCPLDADRIHDDAHVLDSLLHRWGPGDRVGEPCAGLVEQDQLRERGEATQHRARRGIAPEERHVRDDPADQNEVDRTLAHNLVSDAGLTLLRVTRLGRHSLKLIESSRAKWTTGSLW